MRAFVIRLAVVSVVGVFVATGPVYVASAATGDCDAAAGGVFPNGDGSVNDPYLVTTSAQLVAIDTFTACHDENFVQGGDIDLGGNDWTPIGSSVAGFVGTFHGGGHTISGLALAGNDAGLFQVGFAGASFSHLNISVTSSATSPPGSKVGALVGASYGPLIIDRVHVTGHVSGTGASVGGLVGQSGALTVSGSSVSGNVTAGHDGQGYSYAGGVVGLVPNAAVNLTNVSVGGDVLGAGASVGGLVGQSGVLTVSGSSVSGDVTAGYDGLGYSFAGGVVGLVPNYAVGITSTDVTGDVLGAGASVGGLVGQSGVLTVSGSSVSGNVTAGFEGSGHSYAGGVVGLVPNAAVGITSTDVAGDVLGTAASVGGLVGQSGGLTVSGSSVSGNVTAGFEGSGYSFAGGLVGLSMKQVSVSGSAIIGNITGSGSVVGGLVGYAYDSNTTVDLTVMNAFFRGTLAASDEVGGIVGKLGGDGEIENAYVAGSRPDPAVTDQGGLLGSVSGTLTVTSSFCTGPDCDVGNRVDDVDLKRQSTFTGWDFDTVWCQSSSVNDGYPVLRAITNPAIGFAACWAPAAASPSSPMTPIWRAKLDPNGGMCIDGTKEHDDEWTSVFVGYRYLPGAVECERDGFEFSGWADVEFPDEILDVPMLVDPADGVKRAFIAANADLIAVWKEVEAELDDLTGTAPGAFVGGPDRRTREGGGVVEGYYIPPNTLFGPWMLHLDDLTGTAPGAFVGGPDRRTREGGGVVEGYYIPPNTIFGPWMLASA